MTLKYNESLRKVQLLTLFHPNSYDDSNSDSDSDSNILTRPCLSRFAGLKDSARTWSLHCSVTSSNQKKKKVRHTNRVKVNLKDPLASLVISDDLESHQLFRMHSYIAGIHAVKKDLTKFTNGMNCVICYQKHSFNQ